MLHYPITSVRDSGASIPNYQVLITGSGIPIFAKSKQCGGPHRRNLLAVFFVLALLVALREASEDFEPKQTLMKLDVIKEISPSILSDLCCKRTGGDLGECLNFLKGGITNSVIGDQPAWVYWYLVCACTTYSLIHKFFFFLYLFTLLVFFLLLFFYLNN